MSRGAEGGAVVSGSDEVVVGDWVVAGTIPADRDHGRIVSLDGDLASVAWVSGSRTSCDLSRDDVEVYADWSVAKARHAALDAADVTKDARAVQS